MISLAAKSFGLIIFLFLFYLVSLLTLQRFEIRSCFEKTAKKVNHNKSIQTSIEVDFCNSYDSPKALQLWHENIDTILKISQKQSISLFRDVSMAENIEIQNWIKEMMLYLDPQRLLKSVKNVPTGKMQPILDVLKRRKEWAVLSPEQKKNVSEPPPLKILVMGGSVTAGHHCYLQPYH